LAVLVIGFPVDRHPVVQFAVTLWLSIFITMMVMLLLLGLFLFNLLDLDSIHVIKKSLSGVANMIILSIKVDHWWGKLGVFFWLVHMFGLFISLINHVAI
jgi:hypothetical protein